MKSLSTDIDLRLLPLGATPKDGGCYFAVWAPNASSIILHIYTKDEKEICSIPLKEKRGGVWYGFVTGVSVGDLYAYEALGEYSPEKGLFFKKDRYLVDPYAKALSKPFIYNMNKYLHDNANFIPKAIVVNDEFDWQGVGKPTFGRDSLIIYECNVKGLTAIHPDVPLSHRGKYLGVIHESVIKHLKDLGITAVQFNPIAAFISEPHLVKKGLVNYWGYNPVCFMAPDPRYAVNPLDSLNEFRTMVRELHRNGIAVILDVVYNHTGEGGRGGPVLSMKGFDAPSYYTYNRNADGSLNCRSYRDVTGCGNSVNVDARPTLNLVLDSMKHWITENQIDGFRFDLGVTLCRETHAESFHEYDPNSAFLKSTFCIESIASSLLIAEPWDCGPNGYRLGQFPAGWSEQNDKFRDTVRRFWRGDSGLLGQYATRLMGSRDIFTSSYRSINASVNFVTYHDGFTLEDLVSYSTKYNEKNGENNLDGTMENFSTNCGVEGPTDDKEVLARRDLLKRNMMASVIMGQGIPHILSGDELCKTQNGNNNAYCQDNEISWNNWTKTTRNRNFTKFISRLNNLRRSSKMIRELTLAGDYYHVGENCYEAHWFKPDGCAMDSAAWNDPNTDAITLTVGSTEDSFDTEHWCFIINQHYREVEFILPPPPLGYKWIEVVDTSDETGAPSNGSESYIRKVDCPCIVAYFLEKEDSNTLEEDAIKVLTNAGKYSKSSNK